MEAAATHELVRNPSLELLGAFALTQVMRDDVFEQYFKDRVPEAVRFVRDRALSRISDNERLSLIISIARSSSASSYERAFRETYEAVKQVRDGIAHGSIVDQAVFTQAQWLVANAEGKRRMIQHPEQVQSDYIWLMARHCEWLQDVVVLIGSAIEALDPQQKPDAPASPPGWGTVPRFAAPPS